MIRYMHRMRSEKYRHMKKMIFIPENGLFSHLKRKGMFWIHGWSANLPKGIFYRIGKYAGKHIRPHPSNLRLIWHCKINGNRI